MQIKKPRGTEGAFAGGRGFFLFNALFFFMRIYLLGALMF